MVAAFMLFLRHGWDIHIESAAASLGSGAFARNGEDQDVSALQHFRAPGGLAPGPGYSHAVTGRGRWVATSGQVALDGRSPHWPCRTS